MGRGGNASWPAPHRPTLCLACKMQAGLARLALGVWADFIAPPYIRGKKRACGPARIIFFSKIKISLIIKKLIPTIEKLKFYPCFNSFN